MKKFDIEELTVTKLLGITPRNFKPIFLPIFTSMLLFVVGIVLFLLTNNTPLFEIIFGLSGVIFGLSGIGQIKLKEVPGFPPLRGGCAVIFGVVFLLLFVISGVAVIFFE